MTSALSLNLCEKDPHGLDQSETDKSLLDVENYLRKR